MEDIELLCPPADIHSIFAERSNPTFELISILMASNNYLKSTRDLLLPRLISGELDVSELDLVA